LFCFSLRRSKVNKTTQEKTQEDKQEPQKKPCFAAIMVRHSLRAFSLFACFGNAFSIDNGFNEPPMGWSALYGAPFNQVNETIVKEAARGLNASGLLEAGYGYVVLDDWFAKRDANGKMIANPGTFPSGMPAVSDAVHAAGVKFGVYSAASERTCGNWSASLFSETNDANVFANEWKIDCKPF
jgi:hypothetical protein